MLERPSVQQKSNSSIFSSPLNDPLCPKSLLSLPTSMAAPYVYVVVAIKGWSSIANNFRLAIDVG